MRRATPAAALIGAIVIAPACDRAGQPVVPTAPTSAAPGAAQAIDLAIAGNGSLAAIGETSQLTAKVTLADGTIKDATASVGWLSIDPSTIAIAPSGLVTALRYGVSDIEATYQSRAAWLRVTATPPGTFVVYGRVREPGYGCLDGVTVSAGSTVLGVTASGGEFSFGGLSEHVVLSFQKQGFELRPVTATADSYTDVAMQRIVRVPAGQTGAFTLARNDLDYRLPDGSRCFPCRLVRVVAPEAGTVHVDVSWTETLATLKLWTNGRVFAGAAPGPGALSVDVPASPGEVVLYVGVTDGLDREVGVSLTTRFAR